MGKHGDSDGDGIINRNDPDADEFEGFTPERLYDFPDPQWRPESDFTGEWVANLARTLPRGAAPAGVTAATLRAAMGADLPLTRFPTLVADFNAALIAANCTTVNRAAMLAAQLGHESLGLRFFEELWGPTAQQKRYEPVTTLSKQLGNTQPGDGFRYKGRGPIQLTGRGGYAVFLAWCRVQGYSPPDFLADPAQVATSRWGFLAASHYWTVRRPGLNAAADRGDVEAATRLINGGTYGLEDRRRRFNACLKLGAALLPASAPTPAPSPRAVGTDLVDNIVLTGTGDDTIGIDPPGSRVIGEAYFSLLMVKGPKGVEGTVKLFPQKPGGGTGPVVTLRSRVRNDASNTSDRDYTRIPDGTDQIDYQWSIPAGCKALLIPAFRAAP